MDGVSPGNIPLGDHDADWLRVMAAASNSSLRVKVASVLGYYVRRRKGEYEEILRYLAAKYGLSYSEVFNRLRKGEALGDPLDYFEIDPAVEQAISRLKDGE